ncbi:hypothetical protein ACHAW6_013661 [Cyclotella cf. meneghiniana]
MYMARSFIIHAALNWGKDGSDYLNLRPFVCGFFNQIPQCFSGITPIEMVTNIKSDHCDLMCTYVWGCTVYLLEAKFQGGKKLPQWNHHASMGRFLEFLNQHSSSVALICNLCTGCINPKYHMVSYDKFETVVCNDTSSDKLDELFVNSHGCYA